MSLDNTANTTEIGNGQSQKFLYNGGQLGGHILKNGDDERNISPEEMLEIHEEYESRLINNDYLGVRAMEKDNTYPETWLNSVIVNLINYSKRNKDDKNNENAQKLVEEFRDRKFRDSWLE